MCADVASRSFGEIPAHESLELAALEDHGTAFHPNSDGIPPPGSPEEEELWRELCEDWVLAGYVLGEAQDSNGM
ncbi:hypothetical protein FOZ63_013451 [Perkinsus olseni]|uniref:Uncharacterized protein n=1 Tax=Perkinsus olseni TaxID=32597 RepID=A0A7J6PGL0_PEROL|nr:hypothetical protein FOZ60_007766 [Perkinsus olseni]KAF4701469.1 hypothetical protein FOZ62_005000 [Perkinsus olseni]KAF4749261.1 hypothetical protein FOZ63_013451 [Perkinsus olseni]